MAARKPGIEHVILCDDIREEIGNKLSFMGVYTIDVNIPSEPFVFSQFCMAIFCKNLRGGDTFTIGLKSPTGKAVGKQMNGSIAPTGGRKALPLTILSRFESFRVEKAGDFELEITFNGDETSKKKVKIPINVRK